MAKLAVALVSGEGMEEIEFENDKYIYLPYAKVTKENASQFLSEEALRKYNPDAPSAGNGSDSSAPGFIVQ